MLEHRLYIMASRGGGFGMLHLLSAGTFLPLNRESPSSLVFVLSSCFYGEFACFRKGQWE